MVTISWGRPYCLNFFAVLAHVIFRRACAQASNKTYSVIVQNGLCYGEISNILGDWGAERTPNLDFMKRFLCKGGCLTTIITHTLRG